MLKRAAMADIHQTPAAAQLSAKQQLEQRENGIRAAAIKQGYAQRDAVWFAALGVTSLEEAREIQVLRSELKATRTENKQLHQRHLRCDLAKFAGGAIVSLLAVAASTWIMGGFGHDMALTGAAVQASNRSQPFVCQPGERMPDGHTCGVPGSSTGVNP
jgi:hypothetical protein